MSKLNALREFEQRVDTLRAKGLVDLKFYAGETYGSDTESFCKEANEMLRAIENKRGSALEFNDSVRAAQ